MSQPLRRQIYRARRWRIAACASLCLNIAVVPLTAANIPVPNGALQPTQLQHGSAAQVADWRQTDNATAPRAWMASGGIWALELPAGSAIEQTIPLPELPEGHRDAPWYGLLSVDVMGVGVGNAAELLLEVYDPQSGGIIASRTVHIEQPVPVSHRAKWRITASSENLGRGKDFTPVAHAFDGRADTFWHSRYQGGQAQPPHRITVDFGEMRPVRTITCLPRQDGSPNGVIRSYAVYISSDGRTWGEPIARGTFDQPRREQRIELPLNTRTRHLALEITESVAGPWGSVAEINFLPEEKEHAPAVQRVWLHIPAQQLTIAGERIGVRLRHHQGGSIVLNNVRFTRLHPRPSQKLLGRSNGGLGPDLLAAGAFGFDALLEHEQHVLSVIDVRKDTPAAEAGLQPGDVIVAVNGTPLPVNDCNPGWRWFHDGHEAVLGRAVLAASNPATAPSGSPNLIRLTVLRQGAEHELSVRLRTPGPFAESNWPRRNATVDAMLRDMYEHLARTQQPNGEWGGYIRTSFAALALLGSRDPKYIPHVKRAVDWTLNQFPTPFHFGGLGHWPAGFTGLLMIEYHLATGDKRVLPWLEANLRWAAATYHNSVWDMPTLGHGPPHLPYENKSLVAPTVHLLLVEALARRAGIQSAIWEESLPFMMHAWSDPAKNGHGALGYNASYKDLEEFWSRTGLFALAAHLRREQRPVVVSAARIMHERFPWFRNSHAYGEPGGALGLLSLSQIDPGVYTDVMRQLAWTWALAWEPGYGLRYTTPHMGAPYMEGDVLMNALYAMVFTAMDRKLHMTGATDRQWMDVSHLPVKVSPVRGWRDTQQRIHLIARIPGAPIHFRLDGKEPTASDPIYRDPIRLPRAGIVTARTISGGEMGPVLRLELGIPKTGWRIVEATGQTNPAEAIRRAERAIDGLPHVAWLTDVGHNQKGYPHHAVIDMARIHAISRIRLTFVDRESAPTRIRLSLSRDGQTWTEVAASQWDRFEQIRDIDLPTAQQARYLRFEALESPTNQLLQLAEIEVFPAD